MQLSSYKSIKGYTLIEILVGLTIVAIVFTVGYASYREFSRRQAIIAVSKSVISDLRMAQQMASSGQKPSADCSRLNGYNFEVIPPNSYKIDYNCSDGVPITPYKTVTINSNFNISTTESPITFKILGQGTNIVSDTGAVITISNSDGSKETKITVTKGGEIK